MAWTDRPWWTVEDAARLLRVHTDTLYDACASGDFPHKKVGVYIRIPAEALRLRVRPSTKTRTYHVTDDVLQLALPLDPNCLVPVRRFRNGELRGTNHYVDALYSQKVPRIPEA